MPSALNRPTGCQPHRRPRPNYFISLPVWQCDSLRAAADAVHAALVGHDAALAPALVDAASAHLTLGVLALHSDEQVGCAVWVLVTRQ